MARLVTIGPGCRRYITAHAARRSFIHLRVHSAYSLSEGAIKADKIAKLAACKHAPCRRWRSPIPATCSARWSSARPAPAKGVQPIIGCQLSLLRTEKPGLPSRPGRAAGAGRAGPRQPATPVFEAMLHRAPTGDPQLPLCAPAGPRRRADAADRRHLAARWAACWRRDASRTPRDAGRMAEAFGRARRDGTAPPRPARWSGDRSRADRAGRRRRAAAGRHQRVLLRHEPAMQEAHDALLCIAGGNGLMADPERRRVTGEHWFKPPPPCAPCSPTCRRPATTPSPSPERCAVMAETRKPLLPICPKVRPGASEDETVRRHGDGKGWPAGWTLDRRRCGHAGREVWRTAGIRVGRDRGDGVPRLLPDRRRLHPAGRRRRASRWGRAAAPARGRSWPGR